MMNIQKNLELIHQDIERLINEGELDTARTLLNSLRDKTQAFREETSKDEQVLRKLTISINRQKDVIDTLDTMTLTLYSKLIHSEKGSYDHD